MTNNNRSTIEQELGYLKKSILQLLDLKAEMYTTVELKQIKENVQTMDDLLSLCEIKKELEGIQSQLPEYEYSACKCISQNKIEK